MAKGGARPNAGRKRKPLARHKIEGSFRADRHGNGEPVAPDDWPPVPTHLPQDGIDFWHATCRQMESLGVLSSVYAAVLARYAETYLHYRDCLRLVEAHGVAVETSDGKGRKITRRNPASSELNRFRDAMLRMQVEFGLTPSAKSRVSTGTRQTDTDVRFFYGH